MAPAAVSGLRGPLAVEELPLPLATGAPAVVVGVGGVGHIALQLLRVLGASNVVAVDTDPRRRALAAELGAHDVLGEQVDIADAVRELTNGAGADVVLDVSAPTRRTLGLAMLASARHVFADRATAGRSARRP